MNNTLLKTLIMVLLVCSGIFVLGAQAQAAIYDFVDTVEWWDPISQTSAADPTQKTNWWETDSIYLASGLPLDYTHNINDDVDFSSGEAVTEAWLRLDFTNDLTDENGKVWFFGWHSYDFREYVSYGFDGNGFVELGEVDDGVYDIIVNIDWLNDDGMLDVSLSVTNSTGLAEAWLDESTLYGYTGTTTPEPATLFLLGGSLLGGAFVRRKKRS